MTVPHTNLASYRQFPTSYLDDNFSNLDSRVGVVDDYCHNGNFDVWQDGTSLSAGTGKRYLADLWYTESVGTTIAPSRQSFSLGQTDVPGLPDYYHRMVVSSVAGAGNYAMLVTPIREFKPICASGAVTWSLYAKADAPRNVAVNMYLDYGTGGTPSPLESIGVSTLPLSTTWGFYSGTYNIPNLSGKTLGTNNNAHVILRIWADAGSNYNASTNNLGQQSGTFDVARVTVNPGSVLLPYRRRSIEEVEAWCYKSYWKTQNGYYFASPHSANSGCQISMLITFPQTMWRSPVASSNWNSANNCSPGSIAVIERHMAIAYISANGSGPFAIVYAAGNTFDARY